MVACCWTMRRSPGVSAAGFRRIRFGTPSLPMSWSRQELASSLHRAHSRPSAFAQARVAADAVHMPPAVDVGGRAGPEERADHVDLGRVRFEGDALGDRALEQPAGERGLHRAHRFTGVSFAPLRASRILDASAGGEKGLARNRISWSSSWEPSDCPDM